MDHIEIVKNAPIVAGDADSSVQTAVEGLLAACKGRVHEYEALEQLSKAPTKMWSLDGPKLCDEIKSLGAVYWVSKDVLCRKISGKTVQVKDLKAFAECLCLAPTGMPGQFVPTIRAFYASTKRPDAIGVPRFWGLSMFGRPHKDLRHEGQPLSCTASDLRLRPLQVQAVRNTLDTLAAWGGATVVADCGFGKTRLAVELISKIGRRAMVLCNREVLMVQWATVLRELVPAWNLAWLQGTDSITRDVVKGPDGLFFAGPGVPHDVCIGSIDTLIEGHVPRSILESYGTVIVDEAHHLAAASLVHALPLMPCKNVVALSATPDRRDGLEHALYWLAGPASFVYKRLPSITGETHTVLIKHIEPVDCANREKMYANGQLAFSEMLTMMASDDKRNKCILDCIVEAIQNGRRKIIVVSQLVSHCVALRQLVQAVEPGIAMATMAGPKPEAIKAKEPTTRLILATYAMMEEGYDDPTLDTLILATPRSRIQQTIGRIERTHEGKLRPVVYDIADSFSVYPAMWYKRRVFYKSRGFEIQT